MKAAVIIRVAKSRSLPVNGRYGNRKTTDQRVPPALWEIKRIGGLNEIDRQRLIISHAVAALIDAKTYPVVTKSDAAPLRLGEFRGPSKNGHRVSDELCSGRGLRLAIVTGAFLVALGLGWFGGANLIGILIDETN